LRHFHYIVEETAAAVKGYRLRRATTRTRLVWDMAPGVKASLTISACSCWWRLPLPVAGLADSGRPT
jgi:hypothetical protein